MTLFNVDLGKEVHVGFSPVDEIDVNICSCCFLSHLIAESIQEVEVTLATHNCLLHFEY
jgi:hypothetical protein